MATKRKKKKGTSHKRKRRVSGIHPGLVQAGMMLAGAGVGAIAATFVNQAVKTSFATMPAYLGGVASVAMGAALPLFIKPSPMITGVSCGLMGMGAVYATNETFLSLPGISGMPIGLTNASPGYVSRVVGSNYRNLPPNRVGGNLSGNSSRIIGQVAGIIRN